MATLGMVISLIILCLGLHEGSIYVSIWPFALILRAFTCEHYSSITVSFIGVKTATGNVK